MSLSISKQNKVHSGTPLLLSLIGGRRFRTNLLTVDACRKKVRSNGVPNQPIEVFQSHLALAEQVIPVRVLDARLPRTLCIAVSSCQDGPVNRSTSRVTPMNRGVNEHETQTNFMRRI
jgi:hypothetical protein